MNRLKDGKKGVALCTKCDANEFSHEKVHLDVTNPVEVAPVVINIDDDYLPSPLNVPVMIDGDNSRSPSAPIECYVCNSDDDK